MKSMRNTASWGDNPAKLKIKQAIVASARKTIEENARNDAHGKSPQQARKAGEPLARLAMSMKISRLAATADSRRTGRIG